MEGRAVYISSEIEGWERFGRRTGVENKSRFLKKRCVSRLGLKSRRALCICTVSQVGIQGGFNIENPLVRALFLYLYNRR